MNRILRAMAMLAALGAGGCGDDGSGDDDVGDTETGPLECDTGEAAAPQTPYFVDDHSWDIQFMNPTMAECEDEDIDLLFFVGCIRSYDDRNKKVAIAMAEILKHLGLKFAIPCHHDDATLPEIVKFERLLIEAYRKDRSAPKPVILEPGETFAL